MSRSGVHVLNVDGDEEGSDVPWHTVSARIPAGTRNLEKGLCRNLWEGVGRPHEVVPKTRALSGWLTPSWA